MKNREIENRTRRGMSPFEVYVRDEETAHDDRRPDKPSMKPSSLSSLFLAEKNKAASERNPPVIPNTRRLAKGELH